MNPARRAEVGLERRRRVTNCLCRAPFLIALFLWEVAIAGVYRLLRVSTRFAHRRQLPGDDDAEYQLEYVAAYARSVRKRFVFGALLLVLAAVAYVAVDAFYLHHHGLEIVVVPPTMSAATTQARASLQAAELLGVYGNGNESEQCVARAERLQWEDLLANKAAFDWRSLVSKSDAYLSANRGEEHCCCAPMFGIDFNHVALEMRRRHSGPGISYEQPTVVHFFNVDEPARSSDDAVLRAAVDTGALGRLVVVEQSQAHLFAWPPHNTSSVLVLRPYTLALRAMKWGGERLDVNVSAEQAYCVAGCLDLFAGVSVYERARRQSAVGIKL